MIEITRRLSYWPFSIRDWKFLEILCERFEQEVRRKCDVNYIIILGDEDDTAYVEESDGKFEISIDLRLSWGTMVDYLIHEFAHVGTWFVNEENDHGPIWGVEYARLYCIYLDLHDKWFYH